MRTAIEMDTIILANAGLNTVYVLRFNNRPC